MDRKAAAASIWVLLPAVTAAQALATLSVLALASIAPRVAAELGVAPHLVGYQVSIVYGTAALVSAAAGLAVRRLGAGTTALASLAAGFVGTAGMALGDLRGVAVASLCLGVGYGLANPAASHLLARFTPPARRNLVFSLKQTGVPLGGALAGTLLPAVSLVAGWRVAVAVAAALFAALMVALLPLRRPWSDDREPRTPLRGSLWGGPVLVWRRRELRALALMGFSYSAVQLSLVSFVVILLVHDLGWSLLAAGGLAAAIQIGGAVGRIAWGALADRVRSGPLVLMIIGGVTAACSAGLVGIEGFAPAAVPALLLVFGASSIGWNGVFMAEVARVSPPGEIGTATGGVLTVTFAGVIVGPTLFAALVETLGTYTVTFAVMTPFALLGMAAIGWTRILDAKRPDAPKRPD